MITNQLLIKLFFKHKAVKLIMVDIDKRVHTKLVIPDKNTLTIGDKSFVMNSEETFYNGGMPTYFVNHKTVQPLNLLDIKKSTHSPSEVNDAIQSHAMRDLAESTKGNDMELGLILTILLLIGVGYLYYITTKNFGDLSATLEQIREIIRQMNEVGAN